MTQPASSLSPDALALPLHRAAAEGDLEQLRALLAGGADLEARDASLRTPLMVAAVHGAARAAHALLEAGAHRHPRDRDRRTAMELARARGDEALAEALAPEASEPRRGLVVLRPSEHWAFEALAALTPHARAVGERPAWISVEREGEELQLFDVVPEDGPEVPDGVALVFEIGETMTTRSWLQRHWFGDGDGSDGDGSNGNGGNGSGGTPSATLDYGYHANGSYDEVRAALRAKADVLSWSEVLHALVPPAPARDDAALDEVLAAQADDLDISVREAAAAIRAHLADPTLPAPACSPLAYVELVRAVNPDPRAWGPRTQRLLDAALEVARYETIVTLLDRTDNDNALEDTHGRLVTALRTRRIDDETILTATLHASTTMRHMGSREISLLPYGHDVDLLMRAAEQGHRPHAARLGLLTFFGSSCAEMPAAVAVAVELWQHYVSQPFVIELAEALLRFGEGPFVTWLGELDEAYAREGRAADRLALHVALARSGPDRERATAALLASSAAVLEHPRSRGVLLESAFLDDLALRVVVRALEELAPVQPAPAWLPAALAEAAKEIGLSRSLAALGAHRGPVEQLLADRAPLAAVFPVRWGAGVIELLAVSDDHLGLSWERRGHAGYLFGAYGLRLPMDVARSSAADLRAALAGLANDAPELDPSLDPVAAERIERAIAVASTRLSAGP